MIRKAQLFGCIRIIAYMNRQADMPMKEQVVKQCLKDITGIVRKGDINV